MKGFPVFLESETEHVQITGEDMREWGDTEWLWGGPEEGAGQVLVQVEGSWGLSQTKDNGIL